MQEFKRSKVVLETNVFKLHEFNKGEGVSVLVVPPTAGRHPSIGQNLIDTFVKDGRTTYGYELLPATLETANTSIEDLVITLQQCINRINGPVDLVGLCQGTLASTILSCIFPNSVNTLSCVAGTINSKVNCGNLIERYMEIPGVLEFHKGLVTINGGIQKGLLQWFAFSLIDPTEVYIKRWFDIYNLIEQKDIKGIEKWKRNNDWYDYVIDIAGTWYLQDLEWLFRDNRLYNGTFPDILGRKVKLENICCDTYLYAGGADKITHVDQQLSMGNKVSGKVTKIVFEGAGHSKSLAGKKETQIIVNNLRRK
jgi:poly(3-hydroxyalkanoate) synthetase